ncbi:unnamed protein product, partial [Mesorhabditis belari]|uniref:Uncharacterized protein n=1 Tax=Mesorhabditis belari TaxID=2138241 RepID=A0AAF3FH84_9BILA
MLFSASNVHPSMHTSYIMSQSRSPLPSPKVSSARKVSTISSPACTPFGNNPQLELLLLSMLRGYECPCEEKVRLCAEISELNDFQKLDLIKFLREIAAVPAVEDNACKMLVCSPSQFCQAFDDGCCVQKLIQLWDRLYKEIIPTMEDILFPLADCLESFCIRSLLLQLFRDRVLRKCLEPIDYRIRELEPILFTLLMETDGTEGFEEFSTLAHKVMGAAEKVEMEPCFPTFSCTGPRRQMRKASSAEMVKMRSKTLPENKRKSVQWTDLRKSKTVSNF